MAKMTQEQILRAADLHWAYQCGQVAAQGDVVAEKEFHQKCAGDSEAEREYQLGVAEQRARQLGVPKSIH